MIPHAQDFTRAHARHEINIQVGDVDWDLHFPQI